MCEHGPSPGPSVPGHARGPHLNTAPGVAEGHSQGIAVSHSTDPRDCGPRRGPATEQLPDSPGVGLDFQAAGVTVGGAGAAVPTERSALKERNTQEARKGFEKQPHCGGRNVKMMEAKQWITPRQTGNSPGGPSIWVKRQRTRTGGSRRGRERTLGTGPQLRGTGNPSSGKDSQQEGGRARHRIQPIWILRAERASYSPPGRKGSEKTRPGGFRC